MKKDKDVELPASCEIDMDSQEEGERVQMKAY